MCSIVKKVKIYAKLVLHYKLVKVFFPVSLIPDVVHVPLIITFYVFSINGGESWKQKIMFSLIEVFVVW